MAPGHDTVAGQRLDPGVQVCGLQRAIAYRHAAATLQGGAAQVTGLANAGALGYALEAVDCSLLETC